MLNSSTRIYCSCAAKTTYEQVLDNPERYHDIHSLSFCPSCQTPKCKYCYQTDVFHKYCSSCMTDYSDTSDVHCTKNCFVCPECNNMLAITVRDETKDGETGKQFTFTCSICDYHYITDIITKPKSIFNIIRSEASRTEHRRLFNRIFQMHNHRLNYELLYEDMLKKLKRGQRYKGMKIDVVRKLKQMELEVPGEDGNIDELKLLLESNDPEFVQDDEDVVIRFDTETVFNYSVNSGLPLTRRFPIPKRLTSRNILKCIDCSTRLLTPSSELLSTKFVDRWNANEYIPLITASPLINQKLPDFVEVGTSYKFLLNIVNPLPHLVDISLSCPFEYDIGQSKIQASIPISNLKIGAYDSKDHPIRSIPTPYLTKETKVSRAELVMRLGRLNGQRFADSSMDYMETLVDQNDNWGLVPFEITVKDAKEHCEFLVPIYLSIQSRLPESIKALGLRKAQVKLGVWQVINIGNFLVKNI